METLIFTIGIMFLLRWFWLTVKTVKRIFAGTKVELARYGPKGTWALVTGSTDGIGKAIALELAQRGFNIILISRNLEKLNSTAKECQAFGVDTRVIQFDFCHDISLEGYQTMLKKTEGLDISVLVNNVGVGAADPWTTENCYHIIAGNTYPIVLMTQNLVKRLEERYAKTGNRSIVINLAS